jgi:hypothetical protein
MLQLLHKRGERYSRMKTIVFLRGLLLISAENRAFSGTEDNRSVPRKTITFLRESSRTLRLWGITPGFPLFVNH